jgi:hypothetical protein
MMMISKRIEGVLIDPYNNLTFQDLEANQYPDFGFKKHHAKNIKEIYNKITWVESFCLFLKDLNSGNPTLPLVPAH